MAGTQRPDTLLTRRQRIAELARTRPETALTTLAHHIDLTWMHEALRLTTKDGATGIDGQTLREFMTGDLDQRLGELEDMAKSGQYRAPPVRRVLIPSRPLPVLRADNERSRPAAGLHPSHPPMAQVARPAQPAGTYVHDPVR